MNEIKKRKAEYIGKLKLGNEEISCAVLEDGTRVLVERSMANALGRKGSGAYWKKKKEGDTKEILPEYVEAKYLEKYISEGQRILEIGCSSGFMLSAFKQRGLEVYGLDPSEAFIEYGIKPPRV